MVPIVKMSEEELYRKFKELCQQLNMDESSSEKAWNSYRSINNTYNLSGNEIHWLCCAIFLACRSQITRTVGNQSSVLEGNCVSLTRLLRICEISIYEFFTKIKQWMEMAATSIALRHKVEKLEQSFAVSVILYRKFCPIFEDLFKTVKTDEKGQLKSGKKSKPVPCTPTKLFEFSWCLFVCAKGEYPDYSVDLVTSYHILLCCCNLIYANVINDLRKDLVNPSFKGIPSNGWDNDTFDPKALQNPHCIIKTLCSLYEGQVADALETKGTTWKAVIEKFFNDDILHGNKETFMDILLPGNFEYNQKSLNNLYETYVLSCGEVDERIFLKSKNLTATSTVAVDETIQSLVPQTPLTGRSYLREGQQYSSAASAPLANAHTNICKLHSVFASFNGEPSPALQDMVQRCDNEATLVQMKDRLTSMKQIFLNHVPSADRWNLVEALYYHLLQNIVEGELKIRPNLDVKLILRENTVQKTLIVCCVEIVVYCYNPQRKFREVLDWFGMHPFNFYRIIEMTVLYHQDCLTRDIIKHLNIIEEQTLEEHAWEAVSPLWQRIQAYGQKLPLCQNVDKPKMIENTDMAGITPHNPKFSKSESTDKQMDLGFLCSPSGQSVKKQLFQDDTKPCSEAVVVKQVDSLIRSKSDLSSISDNTGTSAGSSQEESAGPSNLLASVKKANPNSAGSLGLFFRKFYKLSSVRMLALCNGLDIRDSEMLKKIWTVFEYSIVEQTALLKDRHLDQMIMCAIYVIFRVTKSRKSFRDIMQSYRSQPQSHSSIYRNVFIDYKTPDTNEQGKTQKALLTLRHEIFKVVAFHSILVVVLYFHTSFID